MKHKTTLASAGVLVVVLIAGFTIALAGPLAQDGFSRFENSWPATDFSQASVDASEIFSGGPPPDGIPPYYPEGYTYPNQVPSPLEEGAAPAFTVNYTDFETTDTYLPDEQQVISVEIDGDARAYPLLLLNNHEIANTEVGGIPVAVTFCPLCNASVVFDRRIENRTLHFGVSGLLRNSDLIMWDHETLTWWQQFTGEAIVGTLTGTMLETIPSVVVSYGEFKAQHPDGQVLFNDQRNYDPNRVSYQGYDVTGDPFLFRGEVDDRLFATERVLGYFGSEGAIAYPLSTLAETVAVNDMIGAEPVTVLWQPGSRSLFSETETGSAALFERTLEDGTVLTFTVEDETTIVDEQTGSTWNVFGAATSGELEGTQLEKLTAHPHFWFAWAAFRPDTLLWEPGMVADEAWAEQE
ncbi:MAG: DUF3179 domain-containing protein [Anaerolineales bacterium]